ncbi:MAG: hypothetical protein KAI76_02780 [Alphaproteobacteria bacterium]|nr:hypothetical protein [Alphaproteobacteria bacterium]
MKKKKSIYRFYFLPFKYLYKLFIFLLFITYLSSGCRASWILLNSAIINLQDVSAFHSIIEKNVRKNRISSIRKWVRHRPLSETEALIEIATPKSGDLEFSLFLEFSKRLLNQGKTKEALFWAQLARYRVRYDTLRCGAPDAPEFFNDLLSTFVPYQFIALMELNPELVKESIRQVLDFDEKYPAKNDPSFTCDIFNNIENSGAFIAPKDQWERLHRNLRTVTEIFLESQDEKLKSQDEK